MIEYTVAECYTTYIQGHFIEENRNELIGKIERSMG